MAVAHQKYQFLHDYLTRTHCTLQCLKVHICPPSFIQHLKQKQSFKSDYYYLTLICSLSYNSVIDNVFVNLWKTQLFNHLMKKNQWKFHTPKIFIEAFNSYLSRSFKTLLLKQKSTYGLLFFLHIYIYIYIYIHKNRILIYKWHAHNTHTYI